jgi:hypothetical protein
MTRKPLTAGGYVKDGAIRLDSKALLKAALTHWAGRIRLTIEPELQTRRQRANRYYWGVVLKLMAEESGHTAADLHEIMKLRHNFKLTADPQGEEVKIPKSTATLKILEFSEYLEAVMLDGAEWLGITFPEPTKAEEWR